MPIEINGNSFDREVIQSDKPVIAEFYSPHCSPCKNVERTLNKVEEELGDSVKVVKLNIFEFREEAIKFSVMKVPTVIGFSKGKITDYLVGERNSSEYLELVK